MIRLYTARDASILYSKKNTAAAAGEVVENDIVRRRMPMLHGCGCSVTAGTATSWLDGGADFASDQREVRA